MLITTAAKSGLQGKKEIAVKHVIFHALRPKRYMELDSSSSSYSSTSRSSEGQKGRQYNIEVSSDDKQVMYSSNDSWPYTIYVLITPR